MSIRSTPVGTPWDSCTTCAASDATAPDSTIILGRPEPAEFLRNEPRELDGLQIGIDIADRLQPDGQSLRPGTGRKHGRRQITAGRQPGPEQLLEIRRLDACHAELATAIRAVLVLECDARGDRAHHDVPLAEEIAPREPQLRALFVQLHPVEMREVAGGIRRCAQQSAIDECSVRGGEIRTRLVRDLHAERGESVTERLTAIGNFPLRWSVLVSRPDRDAILAQL